MRLSVASMSLYVALVATTNMRMKNSVTAFIPSAIRNSRHKAVSSPQPHNRPQKFALFSSTTSTTTPSDKEIMVTFPNVGKNVMELPPRMRFAPSPTGSLHVGGARTALYNWLVAKRGQLDDGDKAAFIIRVEDTDEARSTRESEESVLADLTWLGLTWDEGPNMDGEVGPYRQSERKDMYQVVANKLLREGKAYRCFCTKEDLDAQRAKQEAEGIPARYDGTWRDADPELIQQKLDEGAEYTVRFKVPPGARVVIDDAVRGTVSWDADSTVGDFILLRSNGVPVYNFCVAVDDASMGITTVIRAEEHLTNTLRQGLVLDALDAPRPRYAHCSLILGEDKQKLSKRHGATSCNQFRLDGFLPDAMINYLSLLGWNDGTPDEIYSREELIDLFHVDRIVKSPSVFDMDKLKWVNSQHLKMMKVEDVKGLVKDQMIMLDVLSEEGAETKEGDDFITSATCIAKQMMETTQDAASNAKAVLGYSLPATYDDLLSSASDDHKDARQMIKNGNFYTVSKRLLEAYDKKELPLPDPTDPMAVFYEQLQNNGKQLIVEDNDTGGNAYSYAPAYKAFMKQTAKDCSVKGKCLFHPVRLAMTGSMSGQDVTKQLSLLSMAESLVGNQLLKTELVVPLETRMEYLRKFVDTIPEEFRGKKDVVPEAKAASSADKGNKKEPTSSKTSADDKSNDEISYDGPPVTALDIRVGYIKKVWEHEEADKLYCEEIDVGEDEPRQIASGLRPYLTPDQIVDRKVLVLCNLKTRKLVGFPSHGMVLCASNSDHSEVRLVSPPVDAKIGERVTIPGFNFDDGDNSAPFAENKVGKKKVFEKIAPFLTTSEYGVPMFLGKPLMTSAGVCTSPIVDGSVS
mmetsp:Transcript_65686/g.77215  ORF Transcript_65686/g.77215 Transcript_65686/m.77215 type:complete len:859 (+) Transcript_65686:136-2712(+)